jgi:hypothetical protein
MLNLGNFKPEKNIAFNYSMIQFSTGRQTQPKNALLPNLLRRHCVMEWQLNHCFVAPCVFLPLGRHTDLLWTIILKTLMLVTLLNNAGMAVALFRWVWGSIQEGDFFLTS